MQTIAVNSRVLDRYYFVRVSGERKNVNYDGSAEGSSPGLQFELEIAPEDFTTLVALRQKSALPAPSLFRRFFPAPTIGSWSIVNLRKHQHRDFWRLFIISLLPRLAPDDEAMNLLLRNAVRVAYREGKVELTFAFIPSQTHICDRISEFLFNRDSAVAC